MASEFPVSGHGRYQPGEFHHGVIPVTGIRVCDISGFGAGAGQNDGKFRGGIGIFYHGAGQVIKGPLFGHGDDGDEPFIFHFRVQRNVVIREVDLINPLALRAGNDRLDDRLPLPLPV